jgi:hypothetical protein
MNVLPLQRLPRLLIVKNGQWVLHWSVFSEVNVQLGMVRRVLVT